MQIESIPILPLTSISVAKAFAYKASPTLLGYSFAFADFREAAGLPQEEADPVSTVAGTTYTFTAADALGVKRFTNNAGCLATIPAGLAIPMNAVIEINQDGEGQVEIAAAAGVTIQAADGARKTSMQFSTAGIRKVGDNLFTLFGDMEVTGSGGGGTPTPPAGDLVIASSNFITPGTNSTISVTHPDLAGITPKAALVLGSRHAPGADPAQSNNSGFTMGAEHVAGRFSATNGLGFCSGSRTGQASTSVQRYQGLTFSYFTVDYGITIFNEGNLALKPGGTDILFSTSSGNFYGSVLFFGGTDIDAVANYRNLGSVAALQNIEIGLEPDAIITFANGSNITNGRALSHTLSVGFATKDGQQRCLLQAEANNQAAGAPISAILTDACAGEINGANLSYKVVASAFDSLGFSLQSNVNAGDDTIGYIALDLGGRRCKIVDFASPTSSGILNVTGTDFTPQAAIIVGSNLEAVNPTFPLTTSALMSNFMVSTVTADDEHCHVTKIASGADPTSTHSWSTQKAVAILGPTGLPVITANLESFTATGMQLAFDNVAGTAKRFFALLIE